MAGRGHTRKVSQGGTLVKRIKLPGSQLCHPKMKSRKIKTCFGKGHIAKIANSLNAAKPNRRELEERLGCKKDDDVCLLRKSGLSNSEKKAIEEDVFRPKMPSEWKTNMNTWLSDEDIRKAMRQYEEAFPEFKFLEVVPIDFSAQDPYEKDKKKCIVDSFCHVELASLKASGKTKVGAVFNLDPSYKGGSHWVALFININSHEVLYFDSYGLPPPEQISRFMRSLTLQDSKMQLKHNARRFQYKDSECGMYSMIFILCMLSGESFKYFCKHPISDEQAEAFRKFMYRED